MARIRSIKPEFPQSETIGRLSRDARLLFIQLWTIVDDSGRARAASRMLASLLYPYDDDAPSLIEGWLAELEAEGCVRRYEVDGTRYLDIPNWLKHQKIDKPSASKFPAFVEASRIVAKPREESTTDLGSRTLDLGPRNSEPKEGSGGTPPPPAVDQKADLFRRAREVLGPQSGGLVVSLLRANGGEDDPSAIPKSRSAIEMAAARTNGDKKRAAEYVGRVLKPKADPDRPSSPII